MNAQQMARLLRGSREEQRQLFDYLSAKVATSPLDETEIAFFEALVRILFKES